MNSILQDKKECYVCGTYTGLHKHHVYAGYANRKQSEKYGCWCWLCGYHHNLSNAGVHSNKRLNDQIKQTCQAEFEKTHSREDFMRIFGRNYL